MTRPEPNEVRKPADDDPVPTMCVSLDVVSKAMGHASADTTKKHYAYMLQGTVDKAIRDALPRLGITAGKVRRLK